MKKLLLLAILSCFVLSSCKKKSQVNPGSPVDPNNPGGMINYPQDEVVKEKEKVDKGLESKMKDYKEICRQIMVYSESGNYEYALIQMKNLRKEADAKASEIRDYAYQLKEQMADGQDSQIDETKIENCLDELEQCEQKIDELIEKMRNSSD